MLNDNTVAQDEIFTWLSKRITRLVNLEALAPLGES